MLALHKSSDLLIPMGMQYWCHPRNKIIKAYSQMCGELEDVVFFGQWIYVCSAIETLKFLCSVFLLQSQHLLWVTESVWAPERPAPQTWQEDGEIAKEDGIVWLIQSFKRRCKLQKETVSLLIRDCCVSKGLDFAVVAPRQEGSELEQEVQI